MEQRLTKEVVRLRTQVMSFENSGVEFNLSVPDTQEVKEVFGTLVSTIVQQQKQLTTLQSTMKQMAEDSVRSQEALIAWTTQCIKEVVSQNAQLEERLQEAKQQIKTFSYNMQGFVDETDSCTPTQCAALDVRPPNILKTQTPKGLEEGEA